jgi:hypothetical protein
LIDVDLSCYVLEFSVGPGGARLGDVHVAGTLAEARTSFELHCLVEQHGVDPGLIMEFGALLQLWVVQRGTIVAGIDLRPFLRSGDAEADRAMARLIQVRGTSGHSLDDLKSLLDEALFLHSCEQLRALPIIARIFDLYDRAGAGDSTAASELDRLAEQIRVERDGFAEGRAPTLGTGESAATRLDLDWDGIAAVAPALQEPVLNEGKVAVRWSTAFPGPSGSYLQPHEYLKQNDLPVMVRAGYNDLEFGENEDLEPVPPDPS